MTDQEIYQKFIEYMDNPFWKFTESEHKMSMITSLINPEEAAFLTGFPMTGMTIEEIADIKKMDLPELKEKIKKLCRKGMIYESIDEDSVKYSLWSAPEMFLRVPFWPGRDDETLRNLAHQANKYHDDGWMDQRKPFGHPRLRSIPIYETVESPTEFLPFEDVLKVIDNFDYYTVSNCACRMRYNLDKDFPDSPFPMETCFHFDELGRYIVENGLGREVTKEETIEILRKAADAGLVHGLFNHEEKPETLCNCDLEYCTYFYPYHHMGFDKTLDPSNYVVHVTPDTCKACGLCIKRCPMDAIQLVYSQRASNKYRKAVKVNTELCIGCGVCVYKCKSKSIILKRKENITRPPKTADDLLNINVMAMLANIEKDEGNS